jgi:hypothetical protein
MSSWGFWDWITYGCLGIAAFGLALAAIGKDNPSLFAALPEVFLSARWAYVPIALFLFGSAILATRTLYPTNSGSSTQSLPKTVDGAYAFLQFSDAHSVPVEKKTTNILSWYALFTESIYVDTQDANKKSLGGFSVPPRWTVFLLFENPARFRQMVATCKGPNNPTCAVQFSNDRYAVISIVGDVTLSTLEVTTILP